MEEKKKIEFTIKENDGIIKEEDILNILAGNDPVSKNTIRLLLELFDDFVAKDEDEIFEKHYHLNDNVFQIFHLHLWRQNHQKAPKAAESCFWKPDHFLPEY